MLSHVIDCQLVYVLDLGILQLLLLGDLSDSVNF